VGEKDAVIPASPCPFVLKFTAVDREDIVKDVVGIIRRYLPREEFEIVLFGSWARGDAQENSDVDIGLVGPQPVDEMVLLRINEEIKGVPTLRRIDVVDLNKSSEEFRREALSYAQVL